HGINGLILVSPNLMGVFHDRDTVVPQFAQNVSPGLFIRAQGAVVLATDLQSVEILVKNPAFQKAYQDSDVIVFEKTPSPGTP
ncbi:MAG: hypothetical protein ACK5Y6_00020, partial [Pseudomonadota bacterium]